MPREVIHDVDRPDINGVKPKMQAIADSLRESLPPLPFSSLKCDDNLMSSIHLKASFDDRAEWSNGIFENSLYFIVSIHPQKGKRYYQEGEKVSVEINSKSYKIPTKFRKYTGTPEKAIGKIVAWIEKAQSEITEQR
ncbi:hypothetical protein [Cyanothece sp. BG0011]|uniref:hypothetical protein n=1 Tax=Cyanothece sp. BG0011 TaxID=2082950 RepID=UPI000D1DFD5D|nr:hypothetical protein [Cyanothece sp. BG0011]